MANIPGTPYQSLELPPNPPDPLDPCWCGSGQVYEACHRDRNLQKPESKWNLLKEVRRLHEMQYCSHPQASSSTCAGGIVRSHTLQLAGVLSTIALNRHVYGLDVFGEPDPNGKPRYTLIGVRKASTFTGFCSRHDTELFRRLETQPFIASKEQLFLLAYRALTKEVYAKRFAVKCVPILRKTDKGRDILSQVQLQDYLYVHEQILRQSLKDLESTSHDYRNAFLAEDYDRFSAYIVFTDRIPDFAVSGCIHPEFDFQGRKLQNLSSPERLDLITYTVLPLYSGGIIALVWDAKAGTSCQKLASSLANLSDSEVQDAIVRFTYEYFENCYASPRWWESLSMGQRNHLLNRIALAGSDQVNREPDCLKDDGLRAATWKVMKREWL